VEQRLSQPALKGDRVTRKDCADDAVTQNASEFTETVPGSQNLPSTLHWAVEDFFLKVFFLFCST